MTLEQLIATRPGDRLRGPEGWCGVVVCTTSKGVSVVWEHKTRGDIAGMRTARFSDPDWRDVDLLADEL